MKKVLLVKNSSSSSVGFDFERNAPYIQMFRTSKKEKSYSYTNTFFLSYAFLGVIGLGGLILDNFFKFPVLISLLTSVLTGFSLGRIIVYLTITKSFSEEIYDKVENKQIEKAIRNKHNLWGLRIVKWFVVLLFILFSIMLFAKSKMTGGDFIAIIFVMFGLTYMEDAIHPRKGLKAIKILKKQLEEGKFDD